MYTQASGRQSIESIPQPIVKLAGKVSNFHLQLNRPALAELHVAEGEALILYFDAALGHIGLRAPAAKDPAGARLRISSRPVNRDGIPKGSPQVKLTGLAKLFGIDPEKAGGTYEISLDQPSGLYIVALPKGCWEKPSWGR